MPDAPLDPRTLFAAERTLLAWIRTGLALMGFGFVVARFGLFLRELALEQNAQPAQQSSASLAIGTALVILGILVNLLAAWQHWTTLQALQRDEPMRARHSLFAIALAAVLGLLGIGIAIYLVGGGSSSAVPS